MYLKYVLTCPPSVPGRQVTALPDESRGSVPDVPDQEYLMILQHHLMANSTALLTRKGV